MGAGDNMKEGVQKMPYKGSNREYLNHINIADLLCAISDKLISDKSFPCIMDLVGDTKNCSKYEDCKDCLLDWLDEKRETK